MGPEEDLLAGVGGVGVGRALYTVGAEYQRSGSGCIQPSATRSRDPWGHRQPGWARRQAAQPWRGGCRGERPWWEGGVVLWGKERCGDVFGGEALREAWC